ncbi:hypothetical protein GDO86_017847 [Hymenochirus boettgeri]|uniref:Uncharacterized protein n=1 Tax=Hymenochirus boettgeri TaxID=247094 RepID=A0A8T2IGM8_9PIPI|nr:hypothetical protein GDO86_017847 [Hymenochirus boettgeri]
MDIRLLCSLRPNVQFKSVNFLFSISPAVNDKIHITFGAQTESWILGYKLCTCNKVPLYLNKISTLIRRTKGILQNTLIPIGPNFTGADQ